MRVTRYAMLDTRYATAFDAPRVPLSTIIPSPKSQIPSPKQLLARGIDLYVVADRELRQAS